MLARKMQNAKMHVPLQGLVALKRFKEIRPEGDGKRDSVRSGEISEVKSEIPRDPCWKTNKGESAEDQKVTDRARLLFCAMQ